MTQRKIREGIYLVVDPAGDSEELLAKVERALAGGVDLLQVWNHWPTGLDREALIGRLCALAHPRGVPVLVNDDWQLALTTPLDGVHFDTLPGDLPAIRRATGRPFIVGVTCGNDLERLHAAVAAGADYISFCSMFPSPSAGVCEIVTKETVRQARQLTTLPLFLAGGITLANLPELAGTGSFGVALISAIMNAEDPQRAVETFKQSLNALKQSHEIFTDR